MIVYLRKQLVNDSPTTKREVFNFTLYSFYGGKEIKTEKEPEWWRNFNTEYEALKSVKL
jgi:hypothetical protein